MAARGSKGKPNGRRESFLSDLVSTPTLGDNDDAITKLCKFNFKFFTYEVDVTQNFKEWTQPELSELFSSLQNFSAESLEHWKNTTTGPKRTPYLLTYDGFPPEEKTKLSGPSKSVPKEAKWARFRLGTTRRLIGFVIPEEFAASAKETSGTIFDSNCFYIVYLDRDHNFYSS